MSVAWPASHVQSWSTFGTSSFVTMLRAVLSEWSQRDQRNTGSPPEVVMSSLSSSLVSVRAEDLADHQHAVGQLRFESTHVDLVRVVARIRLVRAGSSASKSSRGMPIWQGNRLRSLSSMKTVCLISTLWMFCRPSCEPRLVRRRTVSFRQSLSTAQYCG